MKKKKVIKYIIICVLVLVCAFCIYRFIKSYSILYGELRVEFSIGGGYGLLGHTEDGKDVCGNDKNITIYNDGTIEIEKYEFFEKYKINEKDGRRYNAQKVVTKGKVPQEKIEELKKILSDNVDFVTFSGTAICDGGSTNVYIYVNDQRKYTFGSSWNSEGNENYRKICKAIYNVYSSVEKSEQ